MEAITKQLRKSRSSSDETRIRRQKYIFHVPIPVLASRQPMPGQTHPCSQLTKAVLLSRTWLNSGIDYHNLHSLTRPDGFHSSHSSGYYLSPRTSHSGHISKGPCLPSSERPFVIPQPGINILFGCTSYFLKLLPT